MMKLSRSAWIAIAAALAIPATVALAKGYDRGGWHRSAETTERLQDGRLAMAKAALRLTPEQDKLWSPVETELRAGFKERAEQRAERKKLREERREARKARRDGKDEAATAKPGETAAPQAADQKPDGRMDMAARFEKMSEKLQKRADRMKAFSTAFTPLYASLSDEQKDVLRPLMRDLTPGRGGRGKGRWAHGGWGGHDGKGRHGWDRSRRSDRGGSQVEDRTDSAPATDAPADAAPGAPEQSDN